MRVSPLGIYGWRMLPSTLVTLARRDASLTHPNSVCLGASAVYAVTIAMAIRGASPENAYGTVVRWARDTNTAHSDVIETLERAAHEPPAEYYHQMGWVRIALGNAFYQLLHAPSFEEGVIDTVRRGGDTDTNGAIVGALMGAFYGRDGVPQQWQDSVLGCEARQAPGVRRPRPEEYWPSDVDTLAEQLLQAGTSSSV
jgi:ADP-ribosylglycohydrolase